MKPILEIQGISKKFRLRQESQPYFSLRDSLTNLFKPSRPSSGEFYALDNVSFNVFSGESIGIVGKNGAGKSTLLKILSKITPPSSGKIISRGRIASLLEVGTGFHPELSGRENIFLNGSILGMRRREINKNFDTIVDFAGVDKFLDTPLKHYSSGMQLRLAFAVAAFLENEILIIDEVLAVGDAEFQKKCLGKMEDISKSGRTILFVSHNLIAVQELCSKSILLGRGKVELIKDTTAIINAYTMQYSKGNKFDLDKRKNNLVYFSDLEIYRDATDSDKLIYPDQTCQFRITVESEVEIENVNIGIGVNDKMNIRLFTLFTKHNNLNFALHPGRNTFVCRIDNLPLKPDIYQLLVSIGTNFELFDHSKDEINLEVSPVTYFLKESPDGPQGSLIIKQVWEKEN